MHGERNSSKFDALNKLKYVDVIVTIIPNIITDMQITDSLQKQNNQLERDMNRFGCLVNVP